MILTAGHTGNGTTTAEKQRLAAIQKQKVIAAQASRLPTTLTTGKGGDIIVTAMQAEGATTADGWASTGGSNPRAGDSGTSPRSPGPRSTGHAALKDHGP